MHTGTLSALPSVTKDSRPGAATASSSEGRVGGIASTPGWVRQSILHAISSEVLGALGQESGPQHARGHHRDGHDGGRDHGSAGAAARALKSALAHGGDAQALLAKVQEGLDAAQTKLAERGFDPVQVAAAASQFTSRVASLLEGSGQSDAAVPAADATGTSTLSASVQIARKERGALTLTTQDGDVLRIRFRSSERQNLELASFESGSARATGVALSSSERSRTRIEVDGALDADELKAIEAFVGKVDALANEFFDGDVEAALAAAASLEFDTEEIAGFSLKLSVSERVQASAAQRTTTGSTVPAPRAQPAVPAVTQTPAAGNSPAAPEVPEVPLPSTPATNAAAPEAPGAATTDPLQAVQDFVRNAFRIADSPLSVSGYRLAWSAKLQLVAEVVSVAVPQREGGRGATALTQLLDRAAGAAGADAPQAKLAEAA